MVIDDDRTKSEIKLLMERNCSITKLDLGDNKVDFDFIDGPLKFELNENRLIREHIFPKIRRHEELQMRKFAR